MSLARTWSVALDGVTGHLVQVEAHLAGGLPGTLVIGLGDAAVYQARDRVRAAVINSGHKWPDLRITLALSPAALPKKGAGFDLALAIAVLEAAEVVPRGRAGDTVLIGELGLDGGIRPVRGVLPLLLAARASGRRRAIVPLANLTEAALSGLDVQGVAELADLLAHLNGESDRLVDCPPVPVPRPPRIADMSEVLGQPEARAALEVAAAGGHHLAMIGPPGSGKTMLATRLPGLLPGLDAAQSLEVTAVHSVAGGLDDETPLITRPPFVDPHHTASLAAVIGGGSSLIRPGSVSLAHRGVLFMDEAPEFKPTVLDGLRQPLESGGVMLARASGAVRFPARFQLVIAANPCPCAAARDVDCTCASGIRRRYLSRISGPLLDRIDIRVDIPPLDPASLTQSAEKPEASAPIAERVLVARERAAYRWRSTPWRLNAEAPGPVVRRQWRAGRSETELVERAVRTGRLTGRGFDRVLRLALTSADLAGREIPNRGDVGRALALRCGEGL
ncbi:YifB family Mg chelatase-like AAA ATPase [Nakamurella lactea]|uniref:YifB family Mg chelatase-like AAA ATPase n=1 Tax=Nakamurella lactea TaxID=459515 RepID=UPI0004257427|nr:YifB family Mg chelatase-like AAA ATPase [Nakamurella lactea]